MVRTTKVLLTVVTAAALALSMLAQALTAFADTDNQAPWHAHYFTENVEFRDAAPGDSFQFIVGYTNGGRNSWVRGAANQEARLGTGWSFGDSANPNGNTNDFDAGWASNWLAPNRIAAQDDAIVLTARQGFFTYTARVPATAPSGLKQIKGQPVIDGVTWLENYGYYQGFNVTTAAPPTGAISVTPTDAATLQTSQGPGTGNENRGARSYTATIAASVTMCVDIALITGSRESGGRFRDIGAGTVAAPVEDNRADNLAETSATIEVVNGVSTGNDASIVADQGDDFVDCVTVPSNRQVTFTVDSGVAGQTPKPVVWVDANNDNSVNLTGTNDTSGFKASSETVGVGGQTTYIAGASAASANVTPGCVTRKDTTGRSFSIDNAPSTFGGVDGANTTTSTCTAPSSAGADATFFYDANDNYNIRGIPATMADFEAALNRGDIVDPGAYAASADASSTFNLQGDTPYIQACTADQVASSGSGSDDIRLQVNTSVPSLDPNVSTAGITFRFDRAPITGTATDEGADGTEGTYSTVATAPADEDTADATFTWTDRDVPVGTWRYHCIGIVDGDAGTREATGGQTAGTGGTDGVTGSQLFETLNEVATTPGVAGPAPTSTDLFISTSGGLTNQLDTGDTLTIIFSEVMAPDSTGDVIQVQDADGTTMTLRCAAGTAAAGDYHAGCSFNTATQTVKGTAYDANRVLMVSINSTTPPTVTGQIGSVAGMQIPTTVVDQGGIRDQTPGDQWNVAGSPDRVIDIE
jgi:hypothetical protein